MGMTIRKRVDSLRDYMRCRGIAAFIVVSSDPHSSEYVANCWKSREWIAGFDGSAGTAVITLDKALLWTDSRYWLAAEKIVKDTGYTLMKDGDDETPSIVEWLCANLNAGDVVAIDGTVCSFVETNAWQDSFSGKGIELEFVKDPFDELWTGRPSLPSGKAEIMPEDVAGESAESKLKRLRSALKAEDVEGMLVTMLDEVAWLTNLRGCDVEYNPVVVAYMIVTLDSAVLFIDNRKLTPEVVEYLKTQGISVAAYGDVWQALERYDKATLLMQPSKCNIAAVKSVAKEKVVFCADSPVAMMKAVKNETEIEGFERAMLAEGVAMVNLLHWLKPAVKEGGVHELDVDRMLTEFRSEDHLFRGLSFATIAAYGENAAIVHYEPTEKENALLEPRGFLLLDCGGQYNCGTTDITRTIALGELTREEKEDYTRVLRGHISLAQAVFPKGTCGTQLDVLARQWLWRAGENYLHGTGHGVGHCLNVHEGPHQIRMNNMPALLLPGMTVTNEPGLYKAGRHGIRIENTMIVKHHSESEFGCFYTLEPLTLCPIDTTPIVPELLGNEAREYLNNYHAMVLEKLSPFFEGEMLDYLETLCAPI